MNMKTKTGRIGAFTAACIGVAALTGATAVPAQTAPQTSVPLEAAAPLTDDVLAVDVTCNDDDTFTWNTAYFAGAPNTQYEVYADYRYDNGGGFGGGGSSFSPSPLAEAMASTYHGVFTTGDRGIGATGTYYGNAGPTATTVYVTVTINGYTQEGWDDC